MNITQSTSAYSVSTKGLNAMSSFGSWIPVLLVVVIATVILALIFVLSEQNQYSKARRFIEWLTKKFGISYDYFKTGLYGYLVIGAGVLIYYLILAEVNSGFNTLKWIGLIAGSIIIFYLFTCLMGLIIKPVMKRFNDLSEEYERKNEAKDNSAWRRRHEPR